MSGVFGVKLDHFQVFDTAIEFAEVDGLLGVCEIAERFLPLLLLQLLPSLLSLLDLLLLCLPLCFFLGLLLRQYKILLDLDLILDFFSSVVNFSVPLLGMLWVVHEVTLDVGGHIISIVLVRNSVILFVNLNERFVELAVSLFFLLDHSLFTLTLFSNIKFILL